MSSRKCCSPARVAAGAGETAILVSRGYLHGIVVETDLTNAVTVLVEDGTTEIFTIVVPGANGYANLNFANPIRIGTSLQVTVTVGAGAGAATFLTDANG